MSGPVSIVAEHDLTEEEERRRTIAVGRGHLVAWQRWDADATPLVLVHGIRDCASALIPLARAFEATHQVLFFIYEDVDRYLDRSADDLARGLVHIDAARGGHGHVQMIAHSMGGIVARASLNSLVDPRWFPTQHAPKLDGAAEAVAGTASARRLERAHARDFGRIDLVTLDTPWHGFIDAPISVRNRMRTPSSLGDMVASSAMFSALFHVPWPDTFGVDYIEAHNGWAGEVSDKMLGLAERADADLPGLVSLILDGTRPPDAMLRNQLAALRAERDYPGLLQRLHAERSAGTLDRAAFQKILEDSVATIPGTHQSILTDELLPRRIAEILTRRKARA